MDLSLIRISSGFDDTLGILYLKNNFECFTLEDEFRTQKVFGETRIPAGTYQLTLQNSGKLHNRYSTRFPLMHVGMLTLMNVPNFTGIMIHTGNVEEHTAGCILVGDEVKSNREQKGFLGQSTHAYKRIYPVVSEALLNGEIVSIKVSDYA